MINLTKDIQIIKTGAPLDSSIKEAITKAKACVCKELFGTNYISPSKVTSSARNEYYNASIVRLFDDHLNVSNAPIYDEVWVRNALACTKKTAPIEIAKQVVPKASIDWLNKSSLERLSKDCVLILHFLWQERAVLLPADLRKPTVHNQDEGTNFYEFAAASYTEVLAFVSKPFVSHVPYEDIPDITSVMKPSAVKNFGWYAWRMIRCTDWHRIEDINPDDIADLSDHLVLTRRNDVDWFQYPISPAAFWNYVQRLYSDRCSQVAVRPKNDLHASRKALASGEYDYPDEHKESVESWLKYQDKYTGLQKSRGIKSFDAYSKSFSVLNTWLFGEYPTATGLLPPHPSELNR
ncbi:MAG: hypothetical protein M3O11_07585, partial [Pseudomonadota bacterium]|nr:hypothetical protein [Pseudomonadota bacterium]